MIQLKDCKFVKLERSDQVPPEFDCGDCDLNDFILTDAFPHHEELMSKTYIIYCEDDVVGFFTLLNDKITYQDLGDVEGSDSSRKRKYKKFLGKCKVPNVKRGFKSFPSVKIGRLAIAKDFQRKNLGRQLISHIKFLFVDNNRTGCRFITVDAYKKALDFYEKNEFKYLMRTGEDTEAMYFDLKPIADSFIK
jgi:GNAT superfamily N-acetyltransferase